MKTRYLVFVRNSLLITDFLLVNLCFLLLYQFFAHRNDDYLYFFSPAALLLYNCTWLLSAFVKELYSLHNLEALELIFRKTWKTAFLHGMIVFFGMMTVGHLSYLSKLWVCFSAFVLISLLFVISRFIVTYATQSLYDRFTTKKKVAIVGFNETGMRLASLLNDSRSPYAFAGYFDNADRSNYAINKDGSIVASLDRCIDYALDHGINEIYSTLLPSEHKAVDKLVQVADNNGVRVKFVPLNKRAPGTNFHIDYLDDLTILSLRSEPLEDERNRVRKRIFDIIFSTLVLLLLFSWLYPLIALLIKLESKGPVFFKQQRTGRDNQNFWCYKFRSMTVNTESAIHTQKNDARVTRVGAFLRKTSLDEVPQFLNVLMGDMSVIGPRPHMIAHTMQYRAIISKYMVRQFLKPGITGWAQVNGYRGEIKELGLMEKRVEHDIWYMENWSLMMDVRIVFMTIINICRGEENAY